MAQEPSYRWASTGGETEYLVEVRGPITALDVEYLGLMWPLIMKVLGRIAAANEQKRKFTGFDNVDIAP